MTIAAKASLFAIALAIGGSAYGQTEDAPAPPASYPTCSRSVTDECVNANAAPRAATRAATRHHRTRIAHRTVAQARRAPARAEARS